MTKLEKAGMLPLGAAALGVGALVCLIAPGRSTPEQRAPFRGRYFAHRGLFNDTDRPENSLAAFRAAAEAGYGVELDVRLTRDGVPVISHDSELLRMTGESGVVEELDREQLRPFRLAGTEEGVPTLAQALELLSGANVPVIVEIKTVPGKRKAELCRKTLSELDRRDGFFCVESFDPFAVAWFRVHAPELLRGQLIAQSEHLDLDPVRRFLLSRGMFNFLGRPQFLAHRAGRRAPAVRLCQLLGAMRFTWTARDRSWEHQSDAVIFERFLPPVHYK